MRLPDGIAVNIVLLCLCMSNDTGATCLHPPPPPPPPPALQRVFQAMLVTVSLLCIPVMLVGKPAYLLWKQRTKQRKVGTRLTTPSPLLLLSPLSPLPSPLSPPPLPFPLPLPLYPTPLPSPSPLPPLPSPSPLPLSPPPLPSPSILPLSPSPFHVPLPLPSPSPPPFFCVPLVCVA